MPQSLHLHEYRCVVDVLREARRAARITQTELALALSTTQSFISKLEQRERRMDVAEFIRYSMAIGADPVALMGRVVERLGIASVTLAAPGKR